MKRKSSAQRLRESIWLQGSMMGLTIIVIAWIMRRRIRQDQAASDRPVTWRRDIEMGPIHFPADQGSEEEEKAPAPGHYRASVPETGETAMAEVVGPVEREDLPEMETPGGDDLEMIEGIGPKINTILQEAGIRTFRKLAQADSEELRQILRDAGLRTALSNPETWSEQAQLAADGEWNKLETLQGKLKAGRRG
jgi:predicted flap endonuclease-1-like 5' DNA nuclease